MSNSAEKHSPADRASALGRWIHETIESRGLSVKYRLRGNNLHVLCEANPCADRTDTLLWLLSALQETDLNSLLPDDEPPIYQLRLYGCTTGQSHPVWTALIYLNQIERHLIQMKQMGAKSAQGAHSESGSTPVLQSAVLQSMTAVDRLPASPMPSVEPSVVRPETADPLTADRVELALSNRSMAKRGQELAIASYLSETLSAFGVAIRVSVKTIPYTLPAAGRLTSTATPSTILTRRLWVACEAPYSPDPALIGEPVTQNLRDLDIEGYRDAVILFQVTGEAHPDWVLRVDLTPPTDMLKEWARWGDVEAVQRLLNQTLVHLGLRLTTASLKEATLHLGCHVLKPSPAPGPEAVPSDPPAEERAPDQARAKMVILSILETLAPQGIHAATVYGQVEQQDAPCWVEWLELPAALHPALSESALTLAQKGDWGAIAFLLQRLLNPDLNRYLSTGGIRLQILPKQDLLHVMCEAVLCPQQRLVGPAIARFLRPLGLPGINGVRIYGRRAGQKHPLWSYGIDFRKRDRLVPEAAPEFAATDTLVGDLIAPSGEPILRPDLTPADVESAWRHFWQRIYQGLQHQLIQSRIFTPEQNTEELAIALPEQSRYSGLGVAAVWGAVGLLLTLQGNWMLSHWLRAKPDTTATVATAPSPMAAVASSTLPTDSRPTDSSSPAASSSPAVTLKQSPSTDPGAFNSQKFTQPDFTPATPEPVPADSSKLPYTPQKPAVLQAVAEVVARAPDLPTFNSKQFDDKLKLYYHYLEETGAPPDVLVIGSSRALRGVDPIELKQSLAKRGYSNLKIFNFGINGATAQTVNFILQQLLKPEQLPRLILWADGARAFNSEAVDITYNGIAASEGYRQLVSGQLQLPNPLGQPATSASKPLSAPVQGLNASLTSSYQMLDHWLSDRLATLAGGTYEQRDRLKHAIQEGVAVVLPAPDPQASLEVQALNLQPDELRVDTNGFLSLAVQFNPATYYQKYAKVPGAYDSDYKNFQIAGKQEEALKSILQFTQAHQIPVVFVNLPLTEDYLDVDRREYEQTFREFMMKTAMSRSGLIFRDMSDVWLTTYGYFSDPSHLNRYGAYAVSRRLAQDPLVPWSSKTAQQDATPSK